MKDVITKAEFLKVCHTLYDFFTDVEADFFFESEDVRNNEFFVRVLFEDSSFFHLAKLIHEETLSYEALNDEAISAILELYSDYVEKDLIQDKASLV